MEVQDLSAKITIFDTTLRDGELAPGVKWTIAQKLQLAELLEELRVDVLEVGYPGAYRQDFDALFMVFKRVQHTIVCGLANSMPEEIIDVALPLNLKCVAEFIFIHQFINRKTKPWRRLLKAFNWRVIIGTTSNGVRLMP
jgi:2-isopropylmalate synthase